MVEEILDFGKPYGFGLECGSKPELLAVLALIDTLDLRLVIPGHGAPFTDAKGALVRARSRLAYLAADRPDAAKNRGIRVHHEADRRALLVSSLAYVLFALYALFKQAGAVELSAAFTALVIGSALLLLSATARRLHDRAHGWRILGQRLRVAAGEVDLVARREIPAGSNVLYAHLGGQPAINAYASLFT